MSRITIGLVNHSGIVAGDFVERVAAALQIQVRRDLAPIWEVDADVVALGAVHEIPRGVSPVFVVDRAPHDVAGVHTITQGVPWAMVSTKRDWALAASHECVEMLVDPTGEATRSARGLVLEGGTVIDTDDEVDYLIEACDPIEDLDHAYEIDGVRMSDFYTPNYFDAVPRAGVRYSFNGALTRPREIGRNGYLSWRDPASGKLRQLRNFGSFSLVDLPERGTATETTRAFVDRHTPTPRTHPEAFDAIRTGRKSRRVSGAGGQPIDH